MRFEWRGLDDLSQDFLDLWCDLGRAACSPNVYLMPGFLLPAVRYLEPGAAPRLAVLWDHDGRRMLALGAFDLEAPSLRFPYRRLSAVKTRHSFQSGVLLRNGIGDGDVDCFLDGLLQTSCRGIRFNDMRTDSQAFRKLLEAGRRRGMRWFVDRKYLRASLEPTCEQRWQAHLSASRHKRLRATLRRLQRQGQVTFRIVVSDDIGARTIDDFLRLESAGWKAATSLLATAESEAFFREVCDRLRECMFFCELAVDGRVIASTANFRLGEHGFAFKIGNDPAYAKFSPGVLVEYAFLKETPLAALPLEELESGAMAGSYIDELWPERIPVSAGHLVIGRGALTFATAKYAWKGLRGG